MPINLNAACGGSSHANELRELQRGAQPVRERVPFISVNPSRQVPDRVAVLRFPLVDVLHVTPGHDKSAAPVGWPIGATRA